MPHRPPCQRALCTCLDPSRSTSLHLPWQTPLGPSICIETTAGPAFHKNCCPTHSRPTALDLSNLNPSNNSISRRENHPRNTDMRSHAILAALAPGLIAASRLHITSYGGTIKGVTVTGGVSTVELPVGLAAERCATSEVQVLTPPAKSDACGPTPSWLTQAGDILYCTDEGFTVTNTALVSLTIESAGTVVRMNKSDVVLGPVSSVLFGNGKALAVAG